MNKSRREFLKSSACALAGATLASQSTQFGVVNTYAKTGSAPAANNYKALVLIFLAGGNDGNNTVIPAHEDGNFSTFTNYQDARGSLHIPRASLLEIEVPRMNKNLYGLHPSLGNNGLNSGLYPLWADGKLAIVTNVGTLAYPTTKAEYLMPGHQKPYQLFSHSDQIEQHHSAIADGTDYKGWGGRLSDHLSPVEQPNALLPMMTSVAGSALFTMGVGSPLVVGDAQTPLTNLFKFNHSTDPDYPMVPPAFAGIVAPTPTPSTTPSKLVQGANKITKTALDASSVIQDIEVEDPALFPATGLGQQLKQVARMIKLSRNNFNSLHITRQVFFCQLGGFDTHAYQLASHAYLLNQFSQAARGFYEEMLLQQASDSVTTFTMSDFNRTMVPNGGGASGGTDHAWANHQFVFGGAVSGGDFYGVPNGIDNSPFPVLTPGGASDTDTRGRWVPSTSVEEYGAAVSRWMGMSDTNITAVFPRFNRFNGFDRCGYMDFLVPQDCGL